MASSWEFVSVDVVYMEYNANRDPMKPLVQFEGNCLVGLADLHNHRVAKQAQKNLTDPRAYKHYKWYNEILQDELYEAPIGYRLQVFHWSIESSVKAAFQIRGFNFHAVSMVIGPDMEYWYGVNTSGRDGFTKRGRYARRKPINPNDQYLYLLPRCPIILASCNCCNQYFQRSARLGSPDKKKKCTANDAANTGRRALWLSPQLEHSAIPVVPEGGTDKELFDTNSATSVSLTTIAEEANDDNEGDEDDEDEDGSDVDILFFKIAMLKFRRTEATTYNKVTSYKHKLKIRSVKMSLPIIIEET